MRLLMAIAPGWDREAHLAALVRAYVSPHLRTAATEHGAPYARMLARVVVEPTASLVFAEVVGRVRRRYLAALATLLPEAEPNALARALGFTVIVMASAPFDPTYRAVAGQDSIADGVETLIEAVTAFCVAGFLALCGGNIRRRQQGGRDPPRGRGDMRKTSWLTGAAVAVIVQAISIEAAAQTTPEPATREEGPTEVDAVIVTAQRREQVITDVPISISVIDNNLLQGRGAAELSEIQGVVPGVYFSGDTNYGTAPIAIRGTGGSGTTFGDEPVAVYVDDVYLGRSAGFAASELLDIEAVEVVRGPQGTLQGRNATAGAVILRTADPTRTPRGYIRATAADPAEYRLEAAVSGPLSRTSPDVWRSACPTRKAGPTTSRAAASWAARKRFKPAASF
jgi:hypothetical protein